MTGVELSLIKKKIGFVGYGNQAKKLISILNKKKFKINNIYVRNIKKYNKKIFTNNLSDLLQNEVIFICTPNNIHYKFIKFFHKGRYVFCEKPPVNTLKELNLLKKINQNKIYYNYNYRFSDLSFLINSYKKKLGKLIYSNISFSHGLATKKIYLKSWRSNIHKAPKGISEILSIHFLDLINFHFNIKKFLIRNENFQKKKKSIDTAYINILLDSNAVINIFNSYYTPKNDSKSFIFENGIILENSKDIKVNLNRDTFDKKGNFTDPPEIYNKKFKSKNAHDTSLLNSVNFFFNTVKKNNNFSKKMTNKSFETNQYILIGKI